MKAWAVVAAEVVEAVVVEAVVVEAAAVEAVVVAAEVVEAVVVEAEVVVGAEVVGAEVVVVAVVEVGAVVAVEVAAVAVVAVVVVEVVGRLNRLVVAEVAAASVGRVRDVHRPSALERAAGRRTGTAGRAVVRVRADHRGGAGALPGFRRQQRLPQRVRAVGRADVVDHVLAFAVGDRERLVGVAHAVVVVVGPDLPTRQSRLAGVASTVGVEIVELRPRR